MSEVPEAPEKLEVIDIIVLLIVMLGFAAIGYLAFTITTKILEVSLF